MFFTRPRLQTAFVVHMIMPDRHFEVDMTDCDVSGCYRMSDSGMKLRDRVVKRVVFVITSHGPLRTDAVRRQKFGAPTHFEEFEDFTSQPTSILHNTRSPVRTSRLPD